jgi:excisionase family DNA binding protein
MPARFLTRAQIAEELNIRMAQCYALIRRGDLRGIKIGGRGTWRIGRYDLEAYIERTYVETELWVDEHPYTDGDGGGQEP